MNGADLLTADRLIALRPRVTGREGLTAQLPGGIVTARRGQGMETMDIRPFVQGDDPRHVDRGATARTGRLHVRRFHREEDSLTLLVADLSPGMLWGTGRALRSVAGCEALAALGWRAVDRGGRVACLALPPDGRILAPFRGREAGMIAAIGAMVRGHRAAVEARDRPEVPLSVALRGVDRLVPRGARIAIASAFEGEDAGLPDRLGEIARRGTLTLLRVTDGTGAMPAGRYPIRLAGGRVVHLRRGAPPPDPAVCGRPAVIVDSAGPVDATLLQGIA